MLRRIPSIKTKLRLNDLAEVEHLSRCSPVGIADAPADFAGGRGGFDEVASTLAKNIWSMCDDGCSMYRPLAICGPWGSGKTSFAIRVLKEMDTYEETLFFDPWMVGDRIGLAKQFFADLSRATECCPGVSLSEYAHLFVQAISQELGAAGKFGAGILGSAAQGMEATLSGNKNNAWASLSREKERICKALEKCGRRQVVVIDNLD